MRRRNLSVRGCDEQRGRGARVRRHSAPKRRFAFHQTPMPVPVQGSAKGSTSVGRSECHRATRNEQAEVSRERSQDRQTAGRCSDKERQCACGTQGGAQLSYRLGFAPSGAHSPHRFWLCFMVASPPCARRRGVLSLDPLHFAMRGGQGSGLADLPGRRGTGTERVTYITLANLSHTPRAS